MAKTTTIIIAPDGSCASMKRGTTAMTDDCVFEQCGPKITITGPVRDIVMTNEQRETLTTLIVEAANKYTCKYPTDTQVTRGEWNNDSYSAPQFTIVLGGNEEGNCRSLVRSVMAWIDADPNSSNSGNSGNTGSGNSGNNNSGNGSNAGSSSGNNNSGNSGNSGNTGNNAGNGSNNSGNSNSNSGNNSGNANNGSTGNSSNAGNNNSGNGSNAGSSSDNNDSDNGNDAGNGSNNSGNGNSNSGNNSGNANNGSTGTFWDRLTPEQIAEINMAVPPLDPNNAHH